MNISPNYYEVLGVAVDASPSQIKAAFKKLALQYHPDVYKGPDAQERMCVILQAYQTLNDPTARQRYDMERSNDGKARNNSSSNIYQRSTSNTSTREAIRVRARDISAKAHRDRQRYYDFPYFSPGRSMRIDLVDITYTFSPAQARTLIQHGMLRGDAPNADRQTYFCHRCHHRWQMQSSTGNPPSYCPECWATDWAEFLLLRCIHCCAVFESEQIRYKIGSHHYGRRSHSTTAELCQPYELFPLCPYCGRARWSPAEDARIRELQLRRMRRLSRLYLVVICLIVLLIATVGAFMLGIIHG